MKCVFQQEVVRSHMGREVQPLTSNFCWVAHFCLGRYGMTTSFTLLLRALLFFVGLTEKRCICG